MIKPARINYNIHEIIEGTSNPYESRDIKYFMTKSELCLPIKFYGRDYIIRINSSLGQENISGIFRLFLTFIKERESRNICLPTLRQCDLFIDVGASHGSWTLPAAALGANVLAIEPDKEALRFLYHQLETNDFSKRANVVADYAGEKSTNSIDSYMKLLGVDNVKLIKIDVEGSEFDVLKGAKKTIRKYKPNLLVELHTQIHNKTPEDYLTFLTNIYPFYQKYFILPQKTREQDQEYYHIYHLYWV